MPILATAATLAAILATDPDLAVEIHRPPDPPVRLWYAVTGGAWSGPDSAYLQGDVGYAGPVSFGLSLNHRRMVGFRPWSTAALTVGRDIDAGARVDLQLWRGLGRPGRGVGAAVTLRF